MRSVLVLLVTALVALGQASLFCPHSNAPSGDDNYRTVRVQKKDRAGMEPMYRIGDVADTDQSFANQSPRFRLLTRKDTPECSARGCTAELTSAVPRHQGSILYQTNIVGKLIPPGFAHVDVATRLYCVIVEGDCGATVPIYRHYKFGSIGIFHAYTTDDSVEVPGYTLEPMPLCYGWPAPKDSKEEVALEGSGHDDASADRISAAEREEASTDELHMISDVCTDKRPPKKSVLKPLKVFDNHEKGALRDHWLTTEDPGKEYEYEETLGKVVVDEDKARCGCLIRLHQMVDNHTEMFPRRDHKLVADFKEPPPSGGAEYQSLPGEVFCVREEGACGATVALRKYFYLPEMDTIYTVDTATVPAFAVPSPMGVMCYIWPADPEPKHDEKKDEANKTAKTTVSSAKDEEAVASTTASTTTKKPKSDAPAHKKESATGKPKTVSTTPKPKKSTKETKKPTSTAARTTAAESTQTPSTTTTTVEAVSKTESPAAAPTTKTVETTSTSKTAAPSTTPSSKSPKEETTSSSPNAESTSTPAPAATESTKA